MGLRELTPEEALQTLRSFRVVDVRDAHEFDGPLGHIEGARRIPLVEVGARADELRGHSLLLVCRSGARSGKACRALMEKGLTDVTNLRGGMMAWRRAGLPAERRRFASVDELLENLIQWLAMVRAGDVASARAMVERLLGRTAADATPTAARVERLLDALRRAFGDEPPADLEPTIAAYREDLADLQPNTRA